MTDDTEVKMLDFLQEQFAHVYTKLDRIADAMLSLKQGVTSLETSLALLHGDFAGQSVRIDRIEQRLERIEHKLDLAAAP